MNLCKKMILFNELPSNALSLPHRKGETVFFWRVSALCWQSSYSADMLWTGWIQMKNVKLLVQFSACAMKERQLF